MLNETTDAERNLTYNVIMFSDDRDKYLNTVKLHNKNVDIKFIVHNLPVHS